MRRAVGMLVSLVLAGAMAYVYLGHPNLGSRTPLPSVVTVTIPEPPPPAPLTDKQILQIANKVCPKSLRVGSCSDYKVNVSDTGAAAGLTDIVSTYTSKGSQIRATAVHLSPTLRDGGAGYARYVAAHEWNHVEQAALAKTPQRYRTLQDQANAYFAPRAKVSLKKTTGGLELLTDCMTILGDGVPQGNERPVTEYVRRYLTSTTMKVACGPKWQSLLPK